MLLAGLFDRSNAFGNLETHFVFVFRSDFTLLWVRVCFVIKLSECQRKSIKHFDSLPAFATQLFLYNRPWFLGLVISIRLLICW